MKLLLALSFLYIGSSASALPAKTADQSGKKDVAEGKELVAPAPVDWIKTYSLSPYSENWNLGVAVKKFDSDLAKVMKIMEKAGAVLNIPIAQSVGSSTDKSQQLSYKLSEKAAKEALSKLKKVDPKLTSRMSHNGELVNVAEVSEKLDRLTQERNMHRVELGNMPSIATMADEMIQHLTMVKKVREKLETQVLLNMTVREAR